MATIAANAYQIIGRGKRTEGAWWHDLAPRFVGLTLLIAGGAKAFSPGETAHALGAWMPTLGLGWAVGAMVIALVAVEAGLGVWLALRPTRGVCWIAMALMGVFACYAAALWLSGVSAGCGCGIAIRVPGVDERLVSFGRAVVLGVAVCPIWRARPEA